MKILFVLPYDNTYKKRGGFTRSISYAPLTLATLAALVPNDIKAEMKIVDEGVDGPVARGDYDIVAITCVASSANRAYELCGLWKQKGSYTVLGGSHPTLCPEEASQYADSVIVGLAEETFPRFISDCMNGRPQKIYLTEKTCGYRSMPIPRRDLLSKSYMNIPTVIASRGCHNHCSFCSIPRVYGNNGFARPISEFIDEVRLLGKKRYIFLDPSLTSDREYAIELFKNLRPLKIKWGGLATIDVADDDELFDLMVASGCSGVLAGFESANQDSLLSVGKSMNNVSEYKRAVGKFHKANIPVLGCFVLGFDGDTTESLRGMVDIVDEMGVDVPRFSILTPFPGTPLFSQYEKQNRILTFDWDCYDTMHAVFQPKNMTQQELQRIFREVWTNAYKSARIMNRFMKSQARSIVGLMSNIGFGHYARRLPR